VLRAFLTAETVLCFWKAVYQCVCYFIRNHCWLCPWR